MVLDITTTNGSHEWSDEQIPGSVPEDITSSGSVLVRRCQEPVSVLKNINLKILQCQKVFQKIF